MEQLLAERIFGIPWVVLALLALAVAVVFVVVDTSAGTNGLRWLATRWLHSLCWLLLGLAALAMARVTPLPAGWAVPLAAGGGVAYLVFLLATLTR
jgi:hypothetical protein